MHFWPRRIPFIAALTVAIAACGPVEGIFRRGGQGSGESVAEEGPSGTLGHHPGRQAHAAPAEPAGDPNKPDTLVPSGRAAAVHVDGDKLVTDDKKPVTLHGFNWFGFNTGTGAPDGLWSNDSVGGDFARTVHRQKLLGFNAVRLPFSFAEFPKAPRQFSFPCPDVSAADLAKLTLDPEAGAIGLPPPPNLMAPPKREAGQCNGYLPGNTTRERYLWAVKFLVDNGFYVLVDNHFREDKTAETDQAAWVRSWAELAHDLQKPEFVGRVFFDLLNEPSQYGQLWEKTDKAGVHALYLAAMDAMEHEAPEAIFFLEGTGQDSLGANWGDGYCTDEAKIRSLGLNDPRPFFTELAGKPYHNRVVLAPHVYGPAVTYAHENFSGPGLTARLDASFGHLSKAGFPAAKTKLILPYAVGEFGSHFTDAGDLAFMEDFAAYLKGSDSHSPPAGWFYWSWNCDSGDTGGLVKDDWKTIEWHKVRYLEGLGLKPWYRGQGIATEAAAAPAPGPSPPPSPRASQTPGQKIASEIPVAKPSQDAAEAPKSHPLPASRSGSIGSQHSATVDPQFSKTGSAQAPSVPPPVVPRDGKLHAQVAINTWQDTEGWMHAANIHLANATKTPVRIPFDISFAGPAFVAVVQSWGVEGLKLDGKAVKGRVTADWASLPPSGRGTSNLGFIYRTEGEDKAAWQITVAGQACAMDAK